MKKKDYWKREDIYLGTSKKQAKEKHLVKGPKKTKTLKCVSCGIELQKPKRRYCSDKCHQKINWVLALSKGLLAAFSTRYAAFSFTDRYVMLDVLPTWSNIISRFIYIRTPGEKPAEDLKNLVLQSGREWHALIDNKKSKSYASLCLLDKNHNKEIDPNSIKPDRKIKPRFTSQETSCFKILQLNQETLCVKKHTSAINTAYRKLAKIHHPDVGGNAEKFKELNEAHKKMLVWAENPLFSEKKALQNCWSYSAYTNRWTPPL